jgi:hypothetical protein
VKNYNGFDHDQRMRALRWLRAEYAAGHRQQPTACDACGKDHGIIEAHSEDYREPFGPHIGAHSLCRGCHVMVHRRFRNPSAWQTYREPRPSGPWTAHLARQTHLTDQFFRAPRLSADMMRGQVDSGTRDRRPRAIAGSRAAIHRRLGFAPDGFGLAPFWGASEASFVVSERRAILKNHDFFVCESEGPKKTRRSVIWAGRTYPQAGPCG